MKRLVGRRLVRWLGCGKPAVCYARGRRHQDRRDLRPYRRVRSRRLQGRGHRQQDRHRPRQREGRRRGPQDHHHRRRRPIQDGRCHQRGRAAAERRQGRPADGRVLERALRADGGARRCGQEVHVGQRVRGLGGLQGQEPAVRLPPAGPFGSVRRSFVHVRGRECQIQAQERDQGRQGRHHSRGRPLRRRRGHGQRGQVQGAGPPDRAQGRLRGHLAGSVGTGDQAAPDAARCHPAHRLQSRHHPVPAPVQGCGPQVVGADRSRRGLRPDRQADRDLQGRRQLRLQRRSGRRAAARRQDAQAGLGRSHRRDGQALQGRDQGATRCRRTSRWASTRPGSS